MGDTWISNREPRASWAAGTAEQRRPRAAHGVGFPPGKLRHGGARSARPRDSRQLQEARPGPTQASRAARQRSPRSSPRPALPRGGAGSEDRAARDSRGPAVERRSPAQSQFSSSGRGVRATPPGSPARPGVGGPRSRRRPAPGLPPARRPRPSAAASAPASAPAPASSQARDVPGRRPSGGDGVRRAHFRVPPPCGPRAPSHRCHRTIGRPPRLPGASCRGPAGPCAPGRAPSPRRPGSQLRGRRGQQRRTERPGRACARRRCVSAPAGGSAASTARQSRLRRAGPRPAAAALLWVSEFGRLRRM